MNLDSGPEAETMVKCCILAYFPMLYSTCFLIHLKITSSGAAPLTAGRLGPPALLNNHENAHRYAHKPISTWLWWRQVLKWSSFFLFYLFIQYNLFTVSLFDRFFIASSFFYVYYFIIIIIIIIIYHNLFNLYLSCGHPPLFPPNPTIPFSSFPMPLP